MKVSVFVPSHITCFFSIFNDKNPLKKGACGAGILIDKGVITEVKSSKTDEIFINGKIDLKNELISKKTLEYMKDHLKISDDQYEGISINHEIEVPVGSGFGTSAASSLGVAIAINKFLDLNISSNCLYQISHKVEVELGSGLGDVIAEISNGVVLRTTPGAPAIGKSKQIMKNEDLEDLYVITKTLGKIDTKSVIENKIIAKNINNIGIDTQKRFITDISIENLLDRSYDFAIKSGLISKEILDIVNELKKSSIGSSMAMLGNTAFALTEYKKSNMKDVLVSKIDTKGIQIN